jgi:hypothetical protein
MTIRAPAGLLMLFALVMPAACRDGDPGRDGGGFLPSRTPTCPGISFIISGTLRTFEDPNVTPLIARVRVGESIDLFIHPSLGSAFGCNSAFGPVQAWTSTDNAVASVAPLSPGSGNAELTGLSQGDSIIFADLLYPLQPTSGTSKTLLRASTVYYCCPVAGLVTCPSAPPICAEAPIDRVRVIP